MIDLTVPHTVMTTRIHIHMPWMNRRVGPGVYHYAGDMRPRLRNIGDKKHVLRGHVTLEYRAATSDEIARAGVRVEKPAEDPLDHSANDHQTNGGVHQECETVHPMVVSDEELFVIAEDSEPVE